jgi:hypothetical protein
MVESASFYATHKIALEGKISLPGAVSLRFVIVRKRFVSVTESLAGELEKVITISN